MSLDYRLREGQTNGDLPFEQSAHFGFCTIMMVCGVGKLDDKGIEMLVERYAEYATVTGKFWLPKADTAAEDIARTRAYAEHVRGMTTNIKTETKTWWKNRLVDIVRREASYHRSRLEAFTEQAAGFFDLQQEVSS